MNKRPKYSSPETNNFFHDIVEAKLKKILGDDYDDLENAIDDVMDALEYEQDPYIVTKQLDEAGWDADSNLYAAMDDLISKKYEAYKMAIEKWVQDNQIKPDCVVGDTVKFKSKGKEYTGQIITVYENRAEYSVFCEEMGHVKGANCGTRGIILGYEEFTKVC
jgi:hypothetical protein